MPPVGLARQEWLCGAALLGVVMVKLMLVDSAAEAVWRARWRLSAWRYWC